MPTTQILPTPDLYFDSLQELDNYQTKTLIQRPNPSRTIPWTPRKTLVQGSRGKLLVCHDYKGGYVEKPQALSYTFNYWSLCDSFIYFSHHRVTIPPPGWVNAAHRQGVKMLGNLIFEAEAGPDCLRLIVGQLPQSTNGPAIQQPQEVSTIPLSPHYAISLAELAAERGFDGYLLNFECSLQGELEQARALAAWITLLQSELRKRVGPHAETVWYDSVIFMGELLWQNRLNSFNLPFFIPSTSFFSNYWWDPPKCDETAAYFLSVDPNILGLASNSRPKTLQDIYMGIDVWGRGSHGGGGFGCYKAIDHISPESLGLSVALFGQAWTWESLENDNEEFDWNKWWKYDRDLWVGNPDPNVEIPVPILDDDDDKDKDKDGDKPKLPDVHGPFQPLSSYFPHLPPPDPIDIPFHTTFCPGVGFSWFVEGHPVHKFEKGWMDVDKQTAMGDLLWPFPTLRWKAESPGTVPDVSVSCNMTDAWNGGSSVQLTFTEKPSNSDIAQDRSFYMPIQTLSVTTQKWYTASIVYKATHDTNTTDLDVALTVRPRDIGSAAEAKVTSTESVNTTTNVSKGWTSITIQLVITRVPPSAITIDSEIGLIFTTRSSTKTTTTTSPSPFPLTILLGQMNVYATPSKTTEPNYPRILWADFSTTTFVVVPEKPENPSTTPGVRETIKRLTTITWHPATSLSQVGKITITSPDDPNCAWAPEPPLKEQWFPGFLYFNIYAAEPGIAQQQLALQNTRGTVIDTQTILKSNTNDPQTEFLTWIGTSGADGSVGKGRLEFTFEKSQLPVELRNLTKLRVFVQGVLETGEVLSWENSVYVDVVY